MQRSSQRNSRTKGRKVPSIVRRPDSDIRRPLELLGAMRQDIFNARGLAWQLMKRNINATYRQSFFGILWAFVPALVTAAGLTLARSNGVLNIESTDIPYPAYVMFSMTLWQTFVDSLTGPMQAISSAKKMLIRVNFPREALVLAKLGEVSFNFAIKMIMIVGMFIWFKIPVTWSLLLAPVALIHMVAFGTFLGVLIAPMASLYQDFTKGITIFTSFWLLLTPVVYPPTNDGVFGRIVQLNPVTPLLVTTRELALGEAISNPTGFWLVSLIGGVGLLMSWILYRLSIPYVIERMSS